MRMSRFTPSNTVGVTVAAAVSSVHAAELERRAILLPTSVTGTRSGLVDDAHPRLRIERIAG
jgi:hypothetical protein